MLSFRPSLIRVVAYLVVLGSPGTVAAQEFDVSGTVFYLYHDVPITEVQVQLKGTDRVVQASPAGTFRITAGSSADTLVVSAPGFLSREVPISGRNSIEVRLEGMKLYVIDGMMADSSAFLQLAQDDIESLRLLIDESAILEYGLAGRGGVIVVTTRDSAEPVP